MPRSDNDGRQFVVTDPAAPLAATATVSNEVEIKNASGDPIPVSGSVTVTNLAAAPVPVNVVAGTISMSAGDVAISSIAPGDNNIGNVDVVSLPSIPAGTNLIGKVGSDTSGTATLSNVAASASNVTVLASNASRKRVVIVNDSAATLYLKFGATASATSYTYILYGGDTYESPSNPIYTGQIDGIWASATGAARVTEMT